MIKFPSIGQYRDTVKLIRYSAYTNGISDPTLSFTGTVKLHGTNAGVVFNPNGTVDFQSRERVLSLQQDNFGFMMYMSNHMEELLSIKDIVINRFNITDQQHPIAIFGEWCGEGIQKGVGISELPRMWVIFSIQYGDKEFFQTPNTGICIPDARVYSSTIFDVYHTDINFASPELHQNYLADLTNKVEQECPVAKFFGVEGIGEGIVWRCDDPNYKDVLFKVKGEKHSSSKVKTLANVDVEAIESMNAFVESVVTTNRLDQGLSVLTNELLMPLENSSIGKYIQWVIGDIVKEESDTIITNQIDIKKANPLISKKARDYFKSKVL
jgi:hypothetical protein